LALAAYLMVKRPPSGPSIGPAGIARPEILRLPRPLRLAHLDWVNRGAV
jgi:hypothetical protein